MEIERWACLFMKKSVGGWRKSAFPSFCPRRVDISSWRTFGDTNLHCFFFSDELFSHDVRENGMRGIYVSIVAFDVFFCHTDKAF